MLTRDVKPLIVSMGDVAASGGYYIAVPAHTIVAQAGTLTGSIGVVTGKFALGGTLDKLGVGTAVVADGRYADIYSPFRPFSSEERAKVEEQMQATYELLAGGEGRATKERRWVLGACLDRTAGGRGLIDDVAGSTGRSASPGAAKLDVSKEVELLVYPQMSRFSTSSPLVRWDVRGQDLATISSPANAAGAGD
jgi:protease-4